MVEVVGKSGNQQQSGLNFKLRHTHRMQGLDPNGSPQYGQSSMAVIAGIWLLSMGVLLAIPALFVIVLAAGGAFLTSQAVPTAFRVEDVVLGVAVVAAAVLAGPIVHVLAAIGIFTRKRWGRWVGLTAGVIGVCGGVLLKLAQINADGLARFNWLVVGMIAAYAFVVAALWIRPEHFRVRPSDPRPWTDGGSPSPPPS